jgi:hypothetical protein
MHLTLVPVVAGGEIKTKPTQHSVKELRGIGIQPDILLCRTDRAIPVEERRKLALFCNVRPTAVIEARDLGSIYDVPLAYHEEGLDDEVLAAFEALKADADAWEWAAGQMEPYAAHTFVSFAERCASWALSTKDVAYLERGLAAVALQWQGCEDPCDGIAVMGALYDAALRLDDTALAKSLLKERLAGRLSSADHWPQLAGQFMRIDQESDPKALRTLLRSGLEK